MSKATWTTWIILFCILYSFIFFITDLGIELLDSFGPISAVVLSSPCIVVGFFTRPRDSLIVGSGYVLAYITLMIINWSSPIFIYRYIPYIFSLGVTATYIGATITRLLELLFKKSFIKLKPVKGQLITYAVYTLPYLTLLIIDMLISFFNLEH